MSVKRFGHQIKTKHGKTEIEDRLQVIQIHSFCGLMDKIQAKNR